ncbi:hypothetical protein BIW11_08246 [Tropilaelaps mercedesae]|uniref:Spaetzle domain-containing protein n=1 Tax=Tropilaelaps mercedesae TaxID=418985 RepID=A0A1V9XQD7_9ACAR|nr:hypothetical protein BIW11_08246 [Tropilaelaps mercedesae]
MLELQILVKILQLVAALLTVVSRGSPLPPQLDNNSSAIALQSSTVNGTSQYNVSDNLLFGSATSSNDTTSKKVAASTEDDESCETEPFCDTEEHPVPDDIQLKVLEQNFDRLRPFFNKDPVDPPEMYRTPVFFQSDGEFVQRACRVFQACDTKSWTIDRPKVVRDIDGHRHFLLNPELGGYRQSISLLRCSDELESCRNVDHLLPMSRPTRCETRFWQREMTAINRKTLEPYVIMVRVPVTCICYIKTITEYHLPPSKNLE